MGRERREWRLRVLTGGDTLRQERLTRDLHDELRKADGLETGFAEDPAPSGDGRKGAATDVALWVGGALTGGQLSRVLVTLVKEWSLRERHRKVEVRRGDDSIVLTGRPDEDQERLVREFLDRTGGAGAGAGAADPASDGAE